MRGFRSPLVLSLISILVFSSLCSFADNKADVQKHFIKAAQFQKAGKVDAAITELQAAKKLMPKEPAVYMNIGYMYALKHDLAGAQSAYTQVVTLQPTNKEALAQLVRVLITRNKSEDALNYSRKLLTLNPKDYHSQFLFGITNLKMAKLAPAADAFKEAVHIKPGDKPALYNLGFCYMNLKKYGEALGTMQQFLKVDSTDPQANLMAAMAAEKIGDKETAIKYYTAASKLPSPAAGAAVTNLVRLYETSGKHDKSIEVLKRAVASDKSNYQLNFNLGSILYSQKRYKEAEPYLLAAKRAHNDLMTNLNLALTQTRINKSKEAMASAQAAVKLEPKNKQALEVYAYTQEVGQDLNGAIATYKKWETYYPNDETPNCKLATVYSFMNKYDQAYQEYDKALKKNPKDFDTRVAYAGALRDNRQFVRAIEQYNKALEIKPKDTGVMISEALCYQGRAKYDDAVALLQKVTTYEPKNERGYMVLAGVYSTQGKTDLAIEQYKKVLELNPKSISALQQIAMLYEKNKDYNSEITTYDKLYELDNRNLGAAMNIVRLYDLSGKLDAALSESKKFVDANPTATALRMQYAEMLTKKQDWTGAKVQYDELIKSTDKDTQVRALCGMGDMLEKQGKPEDAKDSYKKAVAITPGNPNPLNSLKQLYKSQNKTDEFLGYLKSLIEPGKDDLPYRYYADEMKAAGKINDAVKVIEEILQKNPDSEQISMVMANAYVDAGQKDKAVEQYKKILAKHKEFPYANRELGKLLKELGRNEEAVTYYAAAAKAIPFDTALQVELGDIYAGLGRKDEAIAAYNAGLKYDAGNADIQKKIDALKSAPDKK